MNTTRLSLLVIIAAFLAGAFVAVLDPVTVDWKWMTLILVVGAGGLWGFRRAMHHHASASHRLEEDMQTLGSALTRIRTNLESLNARKAELPVYEARFEIDRLFRDDLNRFAAARETMIHVFGMQNLCRCDECFCGRREVY